MRNEGERKTMDNNNLQNTLNQLLHSGSRSNPAMNVLINDYITYHLVLVVVGGFFVLIFLLLSLFLWIQWKRTSKVAPRTWTAEKKIYFFLGAVSAIAGLLIALIVTVNATTVANPQPGFSSLIDSLGTPKAGTQMDTRYQAFNTWLQSDRAHMPSLIQSMVDERLAWQRPKAVVSGVLLVVFAALSTGLWRTLLKKSQRHESTWGLKERALLVSGVATITFSLLLIVIVVANMQGAVAPLTLTLAFG